MKPRRLHSDTIFSICKFSFGSAIKLSSPVFVNRRQKSISKDARDG